MTAMISSTLGGSFVSHFRDQANAASGIVHESVPETSQERATVYSADGQPIGTVTISTTFHSRFSDLNGNHQPDPGEMTGEVDRIKVACG